MVHSAVSEHCSVTNKTTRTKPQFAIVYNFYIFIIQGETETYHLSCL